jgi:hypothetical protein
LKFDPTAFRDALLKTLSEHADALWDKRLALLDQESAEGWGCFHAQALWIRANVPPALVNDMGRQYGIEGLKVDLWQEPSTEFPYSALCPPSRYRSEFILDVIEQPPPWKGYRNFLELGAIAHSSAESMCFDPVVAEVVEALRAQGRIARDEIARDREAGWQAVLQQGRHTPAPLLLEREPDDPFARYGLPKRVTEFSALQSPDWTLWLMQQLAPDFPHAIALSMKKSLLFLKPIDDQLAWAVAVERGGRGNMFRFSSSPALSLVWRKDPTGRRPPPLIYLDVLHGFHGLSTSWPREIEMQLTYHLQRFRRLIEFYQPFVDSVLQTT